MPQEMKKVNGRWVVTGSPQSSDLVPFVKPKAAAPAAKPKPAAAKPKPRPWWDKLRNDALYEVKQLFGSPLQRNPLRETQRALTSPLARAVPQQLALATVGAVDNTNRMAYSLYQRHVQKKPKADPGAGRAGEQLDRYVDTAYRVLGATPPSQMTPAQRELDMTRRSLALNVGLAAIPGAGFGAVGATTGLGTAVRGGAAFATNELLSNYLDDSTAGNIVNLTNQLAGTKLPGAVDVGSDDMVDAANKSLAPNTLAGLGLGAAVGGAAAGFRNIQRRVRAGRAVEVVQRARAAQEDAGLIEKADDGSYRFTEQAQQPAQSAPAPAAAAPPQQAAPAASPMDEFRAANAAMEEQLGMRPPEAEPKPIPTIENATADSFGKTTEGQGTAATAAPEGDLDVDPWDVEYDPSLPESDALGRVVDDLDDEELMVVAQGQGPVVEQVNQLIETRQPLEVNPSARLDMTAAPTTNLAQPVVPFADQWQSLPGDQLRSLASPDNSPELFGRIQGMTGKEFEEFSKADVLDGLSSFESDGITVLPNRLMPGQQVMRTAEIFTDPINLQYKGDVDAGGVQRQGSLDGVESWSTDAEGVLQVWTNPMDGKTYVVNGHNRLAAAKRLGIPSLRVEELLAATAEQARAQGAIANIASGGGTVFDAAKFLRDSGVTDPAQLKQMGIPLDSGLGTQGLALSRLPGNLFQDAVDGRLSLGKAVALGGSGLDEVQMQAAMKAMAGSDITDAAFNEVLQQARTAPVVQGEQADLFGNTEALSLMRQKAELAAKIRVDLIGDKNLFGRVGRNANKLQEAGNRISVQGSTQVAMDAQSVLANFDATKYADGTPISQLLNDGAMQVADGAKPAVVAKRIKAMLVKAAEDTPPIEVQSDLLNAAAKSEAPAAIEPEVMGAADRQAMKLQVLQKAIANGEVRPPSTPIPELPDAPRVNAAEAAADIEANGLVPGSKAAQAMADEVRLAVEYGKADALNRWDQEEGLRDAFDYEARSFDEKKDLGMVEGWGPAPRAEAPQLEGGTAQPPVRPELLRLTQAPEQPGFTLPESLGRAAPRYGRATVRFQSDLDRTAYVLANDAVKPSKSAAKFREAVEAAGLSVTDVVAHGKRVKAALKQVAKAGGSQLELPAQPWLPSRGSGTQKVVNQSLEEIEAEVRSLQDGLASLKRAFEADNQLNRIEVSARMDELVKGLRQVAGDDVRIRILDTYKVKEQSQAWGGGGQMVDIAGMYQLWKDTIHMYRQVGTLFDVPVEVPFDELIATGFHESFHRIARVAMSDKDLAILNTPLARLKASKAMADWGSDQAKIAYDELLTEAAARVFSARFKGEDPIQAILPTAAGIADDIPSSGSGRALYKAVEAIVGALNKVYDLVERSYNLFKGRGFESISSVFDKAARGEMKNTIEDLKLDRKTLASRTMPGMFRSNKIGYWESYNVFGDPITDRKQRRPNLNQELFDFDSMEPASMSASSYTKAAQQRTRQQIEANNQAMDNIRRKAQQEGC
jgi:hypothetical protein